MGGERESGTLQLHWNLPWLTTVQESLMTESPVTPVLFASSRTVEPFNSSFGSLLSSRSRALASTRAAETETTQP